MEGDHRKASVVALPHRVLFDEATLATRVTELAAEIRAELAGKDVVLVGVLTGSFVFLADLARDLARGGLQPEIDFAAAAHYGNGPETTGSVQILRKPPTDVRGRPVLLVDDILDTGYTLAHLKRYLATLEPAWLRTCVLLDKRERRCVTFDADYVGFCIPDLWVFGYGLDSSGQGRALPYVAAPDDPGGKDAAG
jgi:hypoxanthine phosphoribosyltransferase